MNNHNKCINTETGTNLNSAQVKGDNYLRISMPTTNEYVELFQHLPDYKNVDKVQAEKELLGKSPGSMILRPSSLGKGYGAVTIRLNYSCCRFSIKITEKGFYVDKIGKKTADGPHSVIELQNQLDEFKKNPSALEESLAMYEVPSEGFIKNRFPQHILNRSEAIARTFLNLGKDANLYDSDMKRVLIYNICKLYEGRRDCDRDEILFVYSNLLSAVWNLSNMEGITNEVKKICSVIIDLHKDAESRYKMYKTAVIELMREEVFKQPISPEAISSLEQKGRTIHALALKLGEVNEDNDLSTSGSSHKLACGPASVNIKINFSNFTYFQFDAIPVLATILKHNNCHINHLSLTQPLPCQQPDFYASLIEAVIEISHKPDGREIEIDLNDQELNTKFQKDLDAAEKKYQQEKEEKSSDLGYFKFAR